MVSYGSVGGGSVPLGIKAFTGLFALNDGSRDCKPGIDGALVLPVVGS